MDLESDQGTGYVLLTHLTVQELLAGGVLLPNDESADLRRLSQGRVPILRYPPSATLVDEVSSACGQTPVIGVVELIEEELLPTESLEFEIRGCWLTLGLPLSRLKELVFRSEDDLLEFSARQYTHFQVGQVPVRFDERLFNGPVDAASLDELSAKKSSGEASASPSRLDALAGAICVGAHYAWHERDRSGIASLAGSSRAEEPWATLAAKGVRGNAALAADSACQLYLRTADAALTSGRGGTIDARDVLSSSSKRRTPGMRELVDKARLVLESKSTVNELETDRLTRSVAAFIADPVFRELDSLQSLPEDARFPTAVLHGLHLGFFSMAIESKADWLELLGEWQLAMYAGKADPSEMVVRRLAARARPEPKRDVVAELLELGCDEDPGMSVAIWVSERMGWKFHWTEIDLSSTDFRLTSSGSRAILRLAGANDLGSLACRHGLDEVALRKKLEAGSLPSDVRNELADRIDRIERQAVVVKCESPHSATD